MFPFDLDDDDELIEVDEEDVEQSDFEIDFRTGKLTGKIIKGLPAIVQWIRLALSTKRYFYNQYSWNYGCEIEDLIGQAHSQKYLTSEVTRMISDALSTNKDIESIYNIVVVQEGARLKASFTVSTVYGSEEVSAYV